MLNMFKAHKLFVNKGFNGVTPNMPCELNVYNDYVRMDANSASAMGFISCTTTSDDGKSIFNVADAECSTPKDKIKFLHDNGKLTEHTLIYCKWTKNIDANKDYIASIGFSAGVYNEDNFRERGDELQKFINGELDVLIGSDAITTGIDGLQRICNNLIIHTTPYTYASYKQLVGRVYRQGTKFNKVNVHIPMVEFFTLETMTSITTSTAITPMSWGKRHCMARFPNFTSMMPKSIVACCWVTQ